ncbi:deoxyribodipyrimidine photolyase [Solibacillus sp. R5-41]|uniref:cryptochrome/photolyase family protein n=1 Tax=Solibacillus sp. R5-41 TaxID=2048654 RepID=UPI000C124CAD|nr:deoxyribodipyrimidine photo-lyase [Solibacillus sp. R5-41]ATP41329.1 deoxyribodipyrimidine photolyase [Solibacillus sp. R5-41]
MKKIIVWFRKDLRLHDNPALWNAAQQGMVIPVYIWSEEEEREYATSEAARWWLHHSLIALEKKLKTHGWTLILRKGSSFAQLTSIIKQTQADAIFFGERYEPSIIRRDRTITSDLLSQVSEVRSFSSNLLFTPMDLLNQKNEPYKVFTSFWKRAIRELVSRPLPIPVNIAPYAKPISSLQVEELGLLPTKTWHEKFHKHWKPGEEGAIARWEQFVEKGLNYYVEKSDIPSALAVSLLSPHLVWGDISVRSVWYSAKRLTDEEPEKYMNSSIDAFLRQLIWREFAYHQLIHYPTMIHDPLREKFKLFPWQGTEEEMKKWQKGMTGYPLVDAGMRELWETGALHNRVRMVVSSFLVKHLLISWVDGSKWFQETLVDFDAASNAMGWQWVAGSGIDAAPYFRIFNPIIQSQKFDADGQYIRKWLPEIANIPSKYIHEPWKAPAHILLEAGVVLGKTYPLPIIDHSFARIRALEAYKEVKNEM